MDNLEKKIHDDGQTVRLLPLEKQLIKSRILATSIQRPVPTFFPFFHVGRVMAASLIIFIGAGSSLTYAAQQSVPGDTLYHLELFVVEPLEEAIQITSAAKAAYSTNRLEERLEEVKEAHREDITSEEVTVVTQNIEDHVQQLLSALPDQEETEENIEQLSRASALLNVHDDLLQPQDESTDTIPELREDVATELAYQVFDYIDENSAEDLIQEIQETVTETSDLIGDSATSTASIAISEHLVNVQDEVTEGDFDGALQEAVNAKVQALEQEYSIQGTESIQALE